MAEPSADASNDKPGGTDATNEAPKSLFEPGQSVWLYMERVKPGLTKKLAHRWHGPFRIERKVEKYAYELELPDRSGYHFYPVVHVSRLKSVNEYGDRPKTRLAPDITENSRFDFDEELLPEDCWELDHLAGEYEVEAILDDRTPMSTSTERAVREFKVNGSATSNRRRNQHPIYPAVGSSTTICVESGGTNNPDGPSRRRRLTPTTQNETNCTWGNAAQTTHERKVLQHYILHVNLRYRLEKN
ncbi:unnamed protein product [Phytophthora lilii]|uniref:Unnamed protein product n=1 Tax=Phytophthora lilii TaxID=2077276 RepID=A0A9W6UFE1_9STRA|nr:unnamed protein product [Phytophthora lilii]